jgi:molybdopterin/thiamine biosynthesis adenylyltransferase/rhodanese-related sulfurtransferase
MENNQMEATNQYNRYIRQLPLPGFGMEGQAKLVAAKVLVVGAGGLGSPVIQYLAAAGIGTMGIADGDIVELSNLHRQLLFTTEDVGKKKASVAVERVAKFNPDIICHSFDHAVTNKNAFDLFKGYDVIVDCTDNFTARYLISDACRLLDKPLVFAAVFQYEGQVAVFNIHTGGARKIHYRDLFPEPPSPLSVPDCNVAGVLGVLPGLIGIMQATEVIKIITGIGELLAGKLLNYDIRTHNSMLIELSESPLAEELAPVNREIYEALDYDWLCGSVDANTIGKAELDSMVHDRATVVIDVRETGEIPEAGFIHEKIPLSTFDVFPEMESFKNIIVFCQSGTRSAKAAAILKQKYGTDKKIFHLAGGLTGYNKPDHG